MSLTGTKNSIADRVERIVCRNDDSRVKRRREDSLVRTEATDFFVSINEKAIIQLQPIVDLIVQFDYAANARFTGVDLQTILSRSKRVERSSKIRKCGVYAVEPLLCLKGSSGDLVDKQSGCGGQISMIREFEAQPREVLIGECAVFCEDRTLVIEIEGSDNVKT